MAAPPVKEVVPATGTVFRRAKHCASMTMPSTVNRMSGVTLTPSRAVYIVLSSASCRLPSSIFTV